MIEQVFERIADKYQLKVSDILVGDKPEEVMFFSANNDQQIMEKGELRLFKRYEGYYSSLINIDGI